MVHVLLDQMYMELLLIIMLKTHTSEFILNITLILVYKPFIISSSSNYAPLYSIIMHIIYFVKLIHLNFILTDNVFFEE